MSETFICSQFWNTDQVRNTVLSNLDKKDLAAFRSTCQEFSRGVAPLLFRDISVTFRPTTFTRHARMAALGRIGHHVKTFHFNMPHSSETFLPPLIDSDTGETVNFIYEPYTRSARDPVSRSSLPCYGSWELTDLLVRQYPPLFHAAANVPSFIKAISTLKSLSHLKISCPSQDPGQRYRRSIVDYALISVRIAVERTKLPNLKALSLLDIHPAAAIYLHPGVGLGALPNSLRRWRQIRSLKIRMSSTYNPGALWQDHLKHLHSYLSIFSSNLRRLDFAWLGERSPCPVVLTAENELKMPSPALACPSAHDRQTDPLHFPRLRGLKIANTITDAPQIARFIARHHRAVRNTKHLRLKFDDTILRKGSWDEALEPLTKMTGSDSWKSSSEESAEEPVAESMEVPIMFTPVDEKDDPLHKVWNDHLASRSFRPHHSGIHSLQRAGAKTREILFGTEEHMRRIFTSTVFGWR